MRGREYQCCGEEYKDEIREGNVKAVEKNIKMRLGLWKIIAVG